MMSQELHQETRFHDIELPAACLGCGGPIAARFTLGSAHGVCLACRRISTMGVERSEEGLRVLQTAGGEA